MYKCAVSRGLGVERKDRAAGRIVMGVEGGGGGVMIYCISIFFLLDGAAVHRRRVGWGVHGVLQ